MALPRRERSTGTGHREFTIESGPEISLEDDLRRRDFRMNMIARRIDDEAIVDPYGGVADIQAARIDIVDEVTFREDPLRLLRAAQFAARFEFSPTDRTRAAMEAAACIGCGACEKVCPVQDQPAVYVTNIGETPCTTCSSSGRNSSTCAINQRACGRGATAAKACDRSDE